MMRLKQLLGIILLAVLTTTVAAGSSSLAGIRVEHRDNASSVTIHANGTFTHTEYRPTDTLMQVDLAGVSIAHQDPAIHSVSSPGVQSYRIVGYRSVSGTDVARIELNLAKGAMVKVTDVDSGIELQITGGLASTVAKPVTASTVSVPAVAAPHESTRTSHINNIAVARGKDSLNIEVTGTEPMTAKTMKLTNPDRVVVDIPNSMLEGRSREIPVNSNDVKDVRAARYQATPPATRVVVDMSATHDFEVMPSANKLVLRLKNAEPAHQGGPSAPTAKSFEAALPLATSPSAITGKPPVLESASDQEPRRRNLCSQLRVLPGPLRLRGEGK